MFGNPFRANYGSREVLEVFDVNWIWAQNQSFLSTKNKKESAPSKYDPNI